MPLNEIRALGSWPFTPSCLTDLVPENLLSQVIGGISEYLEAPVVLMEHKPCIESPTKRKTHFIYPAKQSAEGGRKAIKTYRYPKLCRKFQEIFPDADLLCLEDSACRGSDALIGSSQNPVIQRCHLGLNVCTERVEGLGSTLAVCTSGKFIQEGEESLITQCLNEYSKIPSFSKLKYDEALELIYDNDFKKDSLKFTGKFNDEIAHLSGLVQHYLDTHRVQREWMCRELITQALYDIPNNIDDLAKGLTEVLKALRVVLPVSYLALFFADFLGARVLPLVAQDGLNQQQVRSVHFNWRKAELPGRNLFQTQQWIQDNENNPEFPAIFIQKGIKGEGKDFFLSADHIIPMGKDFRGLLLVGPWTHKKFDNETKTKGQKFIQSIGHLLVANALSKRAQSVSLQNDRRRDFIIQMTAHSINQSLHTIWNSLSMVKYHSKNATEERLHGSIKKMENTISVMKKNVQMAMSAPQTAVLPKLNKYEMEIEDINLAVLIHICAESLEPRAKDKQIEIKLRDDIDLLPVIRGDRYMLQLMFANILDNAIKYSKPSKEVRIYKGPSTYKTITIIIEDYGWGIPKEDYERIFSPGYRNAIVERGKIQPRGIGLGLFQAKEFAKLHGGTITAESKRPYDGDGLESNVVYFSVCFPL